MNFDFLVSAAKEGLKRASGGVKSNEDANLSMYKKLRPSDFPKLVDKFGEEQTMKYIEEMEKMLNKEQP